MCQTPFPHYPLWLQKVRASHHWSMAESGSGILIKEARFKGEVFLSGFCVILSASKPLQQNVSSFFFILINWLFSSFASSYNLTKMRCSSLTHSDYRLIHFSSSISYIVFCVWLQLYSISNTTKKKSLDDLEHKSVLSRILCEKNLIDSF